MCVSSLCNRENAKRGAVGCDFRFSVYIVPRMRRNVNPNRKKETAERKKCQKTGACKRAELSPQPVENFVEIAENF